MRIVLRDISKRFGALTAVDHVSLTIEGGEFFTLLGPSGCGKTTLLRMVAGFAIPDGGEILFADEPVTRVPPHRRDTGMVFQNYALFPQLTVFENIAYGLRARKASSAAIRAGVSEILESVQLAHLAQRFPGQLSGGQQQRVALARALVIHPKALLMDEPLSNLDARLRVSMRHEIRRIQQSLGITTIYVTHDQEEAMAVSDRIAILSGGQVQQVGRPAEVYFAPRNRFVAEFMGTCNLLELVVVAFDETRSLLEGEINGRRILVRARKKPEADSVTVLLRPEWIKIADRPEDGETNRFPGKVVRATFLGSLVTYQVEAFGDRLLTLAVQDPPGQEIKHEGETIDLRFDPDRPVILGT